MTHRPSTVMPILVMLAIALASLLGGLYVGGYFWLGITKEWRSVTDGHLVSVERVYHEPPLAALFQPAGRVESWVRGMDVSVVSRPPGLE